MRNALESNKAFPYIAWTLIIGFAVSTVVMTKKIEKQVNETYASIDQTVAVVENTNSAPVGQ